MVKEKQLYGYFRLQAKEIAHEIWLRRGNLTREILLITAQKCYED